MDRRQFAKLWLGTGACVIVLSARCSDADELDASLRPLLDRMGVGPLPHLREASDATVDLGQLLFFDKELSGNRDIACASCHHPQLMTADARSLPIGTGGEGLGAQRNMGASQELVPRNSPEIFHRGQKAWTTMFWDSRVSQTDEKFRSPAGEALPEGLDNVLAVQAMFPVTSRTEMRGHEGDRDVRGQTNELAAIEDGNVYAIWQALVDRLLAIPEYQQRFAEAFPDVPKQELGFQHAASAIGAFESQAFAPRDSAWDRYLDGDDSALTVAAKRGAHVFYGEGNCASCHAGSLLTDQQHHNIGVPQLGPGKEAHAPLDIGRSLETDQPEDRFAFRTPPLRNVVVTGPWMHNGAYTKLDDALRHYTDPSDALCAYDTQQLVEDLRGTVLIDDETVAEVLATVSDRVLHGPTLGDDEVADLMEFLFSLTSPSIDLLAGSVPDSVPSGLAMDELPASEVELQYDRISGELIVDASEELSLSALFLRLVDHDELPFEFALDQASWAAAHSIVLSNDTHAQSFLEYRQGAPFALHAGDSIGTILPPGLSQEDLDQYLSVAYMDGTTFALWEAECVCHLAWDDG